MVNYQVAPLDLFQRTGTLPHRINTVYQLLADSAAGISPQAPWVMFPEYVLYWLSGRRVGEYTNATHTGLVNLKTGNWDADVFRELGLAIEAAPHEIVLGADTTVVVPWNCTSSSVVGSSPGCATI